MNKYMTKLKSQALLAAKNPRNKKLFNDYWGSVEKIKSIGDTEFTEVFYELTHSTYLAFPYISDECIKGNFFPNQLENMCEKRELPFTNNFQHELRWWIACFGLCAEQINSFLAARKQYDTCVLLERYEEALEILDKVQKEWGVSFWLYESKIYVYTKLERDINKLTDNLSRELKDTIIWFYALKNSNTITYEEYIGIVQGVLKDIDDIKFLTYLKYVLLPMEYKLDAEDFLPLMYYSENSALFDRYLMFLDIVEAVTTRDGMGKCKEVLSRYISDLQVIQDERLEAMRFCLDKQQSRLVSYQLKTKLLEAKEYLIAGRIQECRDVAFELLKEAPYCVQAINIVAEMDIKLHNMSEECNTTFLKELLDNLKTIYSMKGERKQSVNILRKLINCCSMSNWAKSMWASILKSYKLVGEDGYIEAKKQESIQYLDIETVCECLSAEEGLEYLSTNASQSKYVMFREALLSGKIENAYDLVYNEDLKGILCVCDCRKSVEEKKKCLNAMEGSDNTFEILASKYYLSKLDIDVHFQESMDYAVDLLTKNFNRVSYIPWKLYIDKIEESDACIRGDIRVPILYYVQYKCSALETKDDVVLMCEDFLYYQGKELPSSLEVCAGIYPKNALIFFLRYVCVPDILSTALASKIINSMDLWKERIDICQILCNMDGVNEKVYEEEIRALTQKRKIYSELKIIEENRIHVNVEGIRPRLLEELCGDFARYKLYMDNRWENLFEAVNQKTRQQIVKWSLDAARVFQDLVIKIRDAFVSSAEYGLDFTLSLSIRHGAIGDALRRPLANAGLIAIFNESEEKYEWNYTVSEQLHGKEQETLKNAIIQLNIDTEKIISDLKSKYIQVRTEQGHEEGVFDYCITSYEFDQLFDVASNISELSDFIDYVFEYLWEKTEINMTKMKRLLKVDILEQYRTAFNTVKAIIDNLEHKEKAKSLRRKIVDASNEMQNAVENVCFWFQRSTESKSQDFDLDFVFQMGYETICNMHPETRFAKFELEKFQTDGKKINGQYLKAYSDIFYNLFDNIYKKAQTKKGVKRIEYSLSQNGNRQRIYLQNDYDCTGDISEDMRKLEELKRILDSEEYLEHIKGEGGTGIPKICKIIRKDLNRNGSIRCELKEEQNKFFIEIEL